MKQTKIQKLTKRDFDYFKKCCLYYITKFELNNWTFRFDSTMSKESEGASITRTIDNCQADIHFDQNYKYENEEEIRKSAKHELLHCLVGKLYLLGKYRFAQENEFEREEEELIHKLEKIIS
jgi:hypothetical protein